jgi:hypothetical protein
LIEALRHKTGGSGFDYRWGPWKFSIQPAFISPVVSTQPLTEIVPNSFLGVKCSQRLGLTTLQS